MNSAPERQVDVVVLGGGPAGENVAEYAHAGGRCSVALVESELLGGECSYYACMPSKALLHPLAVAQTAEHLGGLSRPAIDVPALLSRRDEWVSRYDDSGQVSWARGAGLEVIRGHGRLTGERTVLVETPAAPESAGGPVVLRARHAVVLATGSEPVVPDVFAGVPAWDSRDATGVVQVPDRLLVVGGGVVACEAATWLAGLGSRVTLLARSESLLGRFEPFAGAAVERALRAAGVDVRLEVRIRGVRRDGPADAVDQGLGRVRSGPVTVATDAGDLVGDELLVATGRRPRLDDVGLDALGMDADAILSGRAPDWLLAVGDAEGQAPLTHWGKYRARVLGERIAARATGRPEPFAPEAPVPQVVFTDPQIGSVGLTERDARRQGIEVAVAHVPWTAAAGAALLRDDADGGATLVVGRRDGRLLGATFVGPGAGELLHAATVAIVGGVPAYLLRHAVPSYPTASELWLRLLEALPADLRQPPTVPPSSPESPGELT